MPDQGEHPNDDPTGVDEAVMGLLHEHVPLTLLVDLVDAPASEQVLVEEGIPDEPWWESSEHHGGRDHDGPAPG